MATNQDWNQWSVPLPELQDRLSISTTGRRVDTFGNVLLQELDRAVLATEEQAAAVLDPAARPHDAGRDELAPGDLIVYVPEAGTGSLIARDIDRALRAAGGCLVRHPSRWDHAPFVIDPFGLLSEFAAPVEIPGDLVRYHSGYVARFPDAYSRKRIFEVLRDTEAKVAGYVGDGGEVRLVAGERPRPRTAAGPAIG